jgi:hypothetical protein
VGGGREGEGAKSYEGEKAWSLINIKCSLYSISTRTKANKNISQGLKCNTYVLHCRRKNNIIMKYVINEENVLPLDELTSPGAQLNHLHRQFLPAHRAHGVKDCFTALQYSVLKTHSFV